MSGCRREDGCFAAVLRRARALLSEFLPLDDITPSVETARHRTIRVDARLEKETVTLAKVAEPTLMETKSIALSTG